MSRTVLALALFAAAFVGSIAVSHQPVLVASPTETSIACNGVGAHTSRLYRALFGRPADGAGLGYWVGLRLGGVGAEEIAFWMSQSAEHRARYGSLDDGQFVDAVYQNLLGRAPDADGRSYWLQLTSLHGRAAVASWLAGADELDQRWPHIESTICPKATAWGLTEVRPGIVVGRTGSTVMVVADRDLVTLRATDGPLRWASSEAGDIVVNANWFTPGGTEAPLVADGALSGSADTIHRGQITVVDPSCAPDPVDRMRHHWMGEIFRFDGCVRQAVSGVSLVHKGLRADAYPGIDLTTGYTNTNRSHSFLGFNDHEIIVIATNELTASELADRAIALGATEGVMLDGGGSTQIETPTASLGATRPVTSFAVLDSRY